MTFDISRSSSTPGPINSFANHQQHYEISNKPMKLVYIVTALAYRILSSTAFVPSRELRWRKPSAKSLKRSLEDEKQKLVPEDNPYGDPNARSLSDVLYSNVLSGLSKLYPPDELDTRNAVSRTDGYWPFLKKGQDPPKHFTYGEFDFYFFAELLDRGLKHAGIESDSLDSKVFLDIGSGAGRLVVAAAALHPTLKECRGLEILQSLYDNAIESLDSCRRGDTLALEMDDTELPLAPIAFECGSFEDPYEFVGHDADILFVFSSCMSKEIVENLGKAVGRGCKPGTIVITTDFMLPLEGVIEKDPKDERIPSGAFQIGLIEKIDGYSWITGGESTAFIHRIERSLWSDAGPCERPIITAEDMCYEAAMARERGELTDTPAFLRRVSNQMIWNNFPRHWIPKSCRDD